MRQIVCSLVATLSVIACGSNTATLVDGRRTANDASSAVDGKSIDASHDAPQHLYVTSDTPDGAIAQYALPITAASMPVVQVPVATTTAVAVDGNGNMMVGDNSGNLEYFAAPLSSSSTPAATFKNGSTGGNGQLAFASDGSLYAANTSTGINVFAPPFLNASTAESAVAPTGVTSFSGVVFDSSNDLYLSVPSAQIMSNVVMLAPPYTGDPLATPEASNTAYHPMAIFGEQLFVANTVVGAGTIDVYSLPLSSSSAPAFSLTNGVSTSQGVAVDADGNLYVGNLGTRTVTVYAPPFSADSMPTVTLPAIGPLLGIAIGR